MDVQQFIRYALDGEAILFTGAGFSWGAKNRVGTSIPSGKDLAAMLVEAVGYAGKELPVDKAAGAYLRRKKDTDLVELLADQFTPGNVAPEHQVLAGVPWRRVYTTNYDTVYEKARRSSGSKVTSVDAVDEPREHLHKGNVVIHINGSIDRLSADRLGNSFKLTTASYATDAFMGSPWAFHFRSDLRSARAIVFIGYSMYDLDIRRVLFEEDVSDRCLFVTAPLNADNELEAEDLSDLGLLAPIGLGALAGLVSAEKATYKPREEDLLLNAWAEIEGSGISMASPSDKDVQDFLVYGREVESLLLEASGPNAGKFCIPRVQAERICNVLRAGSGLVAMHGGLGTGKTFVSQIAGGLLVRGGMRVFRLNTASSEAVVEAEKILKLPGEKVFIVDGYFRQLDLLRRLAELERSGLRILLLERTSAHELLREEAEAILKLPATEIDIDELSRTETRDAIALLDRHGLWGERQAWNEQRKDGFVRADCDKRLPHLLVSVLDAVHITDKYRDLLRKH